MNSECPACDAPLRPRATSCVCGWMAPEVEKPQIAVANHINAKVEADKRRLNEEAHAWCEQNGLARKPGESVKEWTNRMRLWAREKALRVGRAA